MTAPRRFALPPVRRAALALALIAALGVAPAARAGIAVPSDVRGADALAAQAPSAARDRALATWARRASLPDLLYVLRRPRLGAVEADLARAALDRAPSGRTDLRLRLMLREGLADPRHAKKLAGDLAGSLGALREHPRASVFRVAALLPDSGDYADYGATVRAGLQAALDVARRGAPRAPELRWYATRDDAPLAVAAALDSAAAECGAVVGELLSVPTQALATAARLDGLVVLSPTATDESLGELAPGVLQIGPSGRDRGAALAKAVLAGGPRRVGTLISTDDERSSLATGFLEQARALGATVAWQERYADGTPDFRAQVRAMVAAKVEVLLWEGSPREGDALIRELAKQHAAVAVCGGEALSPDRYHGQARQLLEGVRFVSEDWVLPPAERVALDSALAARGERPADGLCARGWIAGRLVGAAVADGALSPGELATALARRVTHESWGARRRFLDGAELGLTLPVWRVERGKAVPGY